MHYVCTALLWNKTWRLGVVCTQVECKEGTAHKDPPICHPKHTDKLEHSVICHHPSTKILFHITSIACCFSKNQKTKNQERHKQHKHNNNNNINIIITVFIVIMIQNSTIENTAFCLGTSGIDKRHFTRQRHGSRKRIDCVIQLSERLSSLLGGARGTTQSSNPPPLPNEGSYEPIVVPKEGFWSFFASPTSVCGCSPPPPP